MSSGLETGVTDSDVELVTDIPAFFTQCAKMGKLIYVGSSDAHVAVAEELAAQHKLQVMKDESNVSVLRQTTQQTVHIVTQARLMRGFDYRSSDNAGIALLICVQFDSKRAVYQALGRVGRYGDPCKRCKLIPELYDEEQGSKL